MDALTTVLTGAQLAVFTLVLAWLGKRCLEALERRFDEIDRRLDRLEAEVSSLRRDFNQLLLTLVGPRPQTG